MGNTDTFVEWMWIWYVWHRINQCHVVVNKKITNNCVQNYI